MPQRVRACETTDMDPEDLISFDHVGATYAIYRAPEGRFYATAGRCAHEDVHRCDVLVMGHLIEYPKHNGWFDYSTGQAKRAPVCVDLRTFPINTEDASVFIEVD